MKQPIGKVTLLLWCGAGLVIAGALWQIRTGLTTGTRIPQANTANLWLLPGEEEPVVQVGDNPLLIPLTQLSTKRLRSWGSRLQGKRLLLRVDPRVSIGDVAAVQQRLREALPNAGPADWIIFSSSRERRSKS